MFSHLRPKLSYSNAIATIALFIALGGVAVAAGLPKNSVGPNQLKRGAVSTVKLRKEAVTSAKLARKSVIAAKLAPNSVGPGAIGNGAVTTAKLAAGSVIASSIKNGVVTSNKLANNAVTTAKLTDGSVTLAKLGSEVGPLIGTLKSGQTLRGMFNLGGTAYTNGAKAQSGQSLAFPLTNAPTVNVIDPATATTIACPGLSGGNAQTPQAAAGQLCIYVTGKTNAATPTVPAGTLTRLGFGLETSAVTGTAGGNEFAATGQWAVTAP